MKIINAFYLFRLAIFYAPFRLCLLLWLAMAVKCSFENARKYQFTWLSIVKPPFFMHNEGIWKKIVCISIQTTYIKYLIFWIRHIEYTISKLPNKISNMGYEISYIVEKGSFSPLSLTQISWHRWIYQCPSFSIFCSKAAAVCWNITGEANTITT